MGHPRPKKSWRPRLRSRETKESGSNITGDVANDSVKPENHTKPKQLNEKDALLIRVWGAHPPDCIKLIPVELNCATILQWKLEEHCAELYSLDVHNSLESRKQYVSRLINDLIPKLMSLSLSWLSSELQNNTYSVDMLALVTDSCWLTLLSDFVDKLEHADEWAKTYMTKHLSKLVAVYLTQANMILQDQLDSSTTCINLALGILDRLLDLSLIADRFIPITDPLIKATIAAYKNLPNLAEKDSVALKQIPASNVELITKANFMQMADLGYHVAVANRATNLLLKYLKLLHMHPAFCDFAPILTAQLRQLLKLAETKALASRIQERLRVLMGTIETVAVHVEHYRSDLQSTTTPLRLQVIDKKVRELWGLEGMKSFL